MFWKIEIIGKFKIQAGSLMSKGLRQNVKDNIEKCQSAAIASVEVYNRPGPRFRTAHFLVMVIIAWTALFHAIFYNRGRRPWYRKNTTGSGSGVRYMRIDGDPKHWDLSECLKQYHGNNHPAERSNLEFLIKLRHKIEHRHLPEMDVSLYGECQAALINLEGLLVSEFGQKYALAEQLMVSLQFSQVIPQEKKKAAKILASNEARTVQEYIEKFRGALPSTVLNSMKYSFNVFLVPKVVNREKAADAAVEFISLDEASDEELDRLGKLNVLIKEKHIPIVNQGLMKPSQVVEELSERLSVKFTMSDHVAAWKYYDVRPSSGSPNPEKSKTDFCIYDKAHKDYLYTRAWVEKIFQAFSDPSQIQKIKTKSQ